MVTVAMWIEVCMISLSLALVPRWTADRSTGGRGTGIYSGSYIFARVSSRIHVEGGFRVGIAETVIRDKKSVSTLNRIDDVSVSNDASHTSFREITRTLTAKKVQSETGVTIQRRGVFVTIFHDGNTICGRTAHNYTPTYLWNDVMPDPNAGRSYVVRNMGRRVLHKVSLWCMRVVAKGTIDGVRASVVGTIVVRASKFELLRESWSGTIGKTRVSDVATYSRWGETVPVRLPPHGIPQHCRKLFDG